MQVYKLSTDEFGRELTQHGSIDFPCAGYDESFSKFLLGEVPWHWHEELEIVVVYEGSTRVEYIGGDMQVSVGEGILINSNTAHRLTRIGETECKIRNFLLIPNLLSGQSENKIFRNYIYPVCSNRSLQVMKFTPENPWHQELLAQFDKAFEAYSLAKPGFEMAVVSGLMEFWRLICVNRPDLLAAVSDSSADERRIKLIMEFIDVNYMENITVRTISSSANISESECFRVFKRTLKSSPIDYLLKIRLQKASAVLLNADRSVQEIALDSGFNSSAYFTKKFRAFFGITPSEYRKGKRRED